MVTWPWLERLVARLKFNVSSPIHALYAEQAEIEATMPVGSMRTLKIADIYMRLSNAYAIRTAYGNTGENFVASMYNELYKSFREKGILQKQKEDRTNAKGN